MTFPTAWAPYCGAAPTPGEIWSRWNPDIGPVGLIALGGVWAGLSLRGERRIYALAACMILAAVFLSPLCALSSALFSARTLHHLLLVAAAAPLIALALPMTRQRNLALATLVQTIALWSWHAPAAYALALSGDAAYWAMQASLLGTAVWFWGAVRAAPCPSAVTALLAAMIQMGLLGALIAFAGRPLYAPHLFTTVAWGLSPLQDQQAAGLIMWIPAGAAYLLAALALAGRAIGPAQAARSA